MKLPKLAVLVASVFGCCLTVYATSVSNVRESIPPDMTNTTLVWSLAELASNAYHPWDNSTDIQPKSWRNETNLWQYVSSFGWTNDDTPDPRGHIFTHVADKVSVIAFKGTSPRSKSDSEQDNYCFGCCCNSVCKEDTCDISAFKEWFIKKSYFHLSKEGLEEAKAKLPGQEIWFVGHSLGAVVASTAALELGHYAVGFAAPGDQLFATRAELKIENQDKVHHVGYHLDPIYKGSCGLTCRIAGYYVDSKCHLGKTYTYNDTSIALAEIDRSERLYHDMSIGHQTFLINNHYKTGDWHSELVQADSQVKIARVIMSDVVNTGFPWYIRYHTLGWLIDNILKKELPVPIGDKETECVESCK